MTASGHIRRRITKEGKVSYQIIVESERDPVTGKRQRIYKTINGTKREADALLNKMIYETINNSTIVQPSAMKLSDWIEEWYRLYTTQLSPTTRAGYRQQIDYRIIPYLGRFPLKNLKTKDVQKWVNFLSHDEGLSGQTVKNIFLNLKAALNVAKKQKLISENPCLDVILPTVKPYKAKVYNEAEIKNLLSLAKDSDMFLIAVIEIYLGIRKGEIAELKWSDFDFDLGLVHITRSRVLVNGEIIIKPPKSEAGIRDIWLGNEALLIFKKEYDKYIEKTKATGFADNGYVICKNNGDPYVPDSIAQKWERFRDANNLPKIRFHDLRHTCATTMIAAGVDPKTVQTRLGHSDVLTTLNIYSHCLPSMNKAAGDTMDKIFK